MSDPRPSVYRVSERLDPRLILQGSRRLWAYYRDIPTDAGAVGAAWEITNACDARCGFCGTHELRKRLGERDRAQVIRIADGLGRAGLSYVNLTGGEPLVSKHVIPIMDRLRAYGVRVMMNTNGSRLAELASELAPRLSIVTISLDSLHAEEHDRVRVKPGLTRLIEQGIEALRRQPGGDKVVVRIRSIVAPWNFRELVAFADAWRGRVDEVCFQPLQDGGADDIHRGEADGPGFAPELEAEFRAVIAELIARYPEYDAFYYRSMADFLFAPERIKNAFHCVLPALFFRVMSNGDVVLCSDARAVTGNLLTQEVNEVFEHPAFQALRSQSRRRCRSCLCWIQPLRMNEMVPTWLPRLIPAAR